MRLMENFSDLFGLNIPKLPPHPPSG